MKKIFLDTIIILDLIILRKPFHYDAKTIFKKAADKELILYISALTFANVNYIISKSISGSDRRNLLQKLRMQVSILDLNEKIIELALNDTDFTDVEDGFQYYTAVENKINTILTRDEKDFSASIISVLTPKEFLAAL